MIYSRLYDDHDDVWTDDWVLNQNLLHYIIYESTHGIHLDIDLLICL